MVTSKRPHSVFWSSPSPLWAGDVSENGIPAFRSPAILRFANDDFMNELTSILQKDPAQLSEIIARFETWETPMSPQFTGPLASAAQALSSPAGKLQRMRTAMSRVKKTAQGAAESGSETLKLFQPAHQRFYLAAGCLICRPTGLGDHTLDTALQERVCFVVRRLVNSDVTAPEGPPGGGDFSGWSEQAFVGSGPASGWRTVGPFDSNEAENIDNEEERLPLFPVRFIEDSGKKRRLFAGLIPVGRKEAYAAAPHIEPSAEGKPASVAITRKTARMRHFQMKVAGPWERLIEQAETVNSQQDNSFADIKTEDPPSPKNKDLFNATREQLLVSSWYILLDFAKYLQTYAKDFWNGWVVPESAGQTPGAEKNLRDALDAIHLLSGGKSLREVLKSIDDYALWLETTTESPGTANASKWPSSFPLADPESGKDLLVNVHLTQPAMLQETADGAKSDEVIDEGVVSSWDNARIQLRYLTTLVVRALPAELADSNPPAPQPPPPLLASQQAADIREGYYCIRFVFERPLCGPLQKPVISGPSRIFRMGGFFDPQAPARPIRIGLPIDTTPAGLRKFDKNTAFMISSTLCGQIKRFKKLTFGDMVLSVLPWPFHKDLPDASGGPCKKGGLDIGMICSLSIPIITICAFILLIVIIALLDFVFKWMPFFMICFPLPGFKAKKEA